MSCFCSWSFDWSEHIEVLTTLKALILTIFAAQMYDHFHEGGKMSNLRLQLRRLFAIDFDYRATQQASVINYKLTESGLTDFLSL